MIPEQTEHKTENKPGFGEVRLQRDGSIISGERIAVLQCGITVIPGFSDRGMKDDGFAEACKASAGRFSTLSTIP
jgi:hypothetical protein